MTISASNYSISATARDIVTSALRELDVVGAEETPSAAEAARGLEKLQRLIDQWNARRSLIYNVNFASYVLLTNTQPITIGPGGNFNVAIRPVRIVAASLILTSVTPNVDAPQLNIRDDAWWAAQTVKGLTSTLPTDLYYSPDSPLGNLYFWPIPTQANSVRLETWVNLAQAVNLNTSLGMPAGYWDAVILTLARNLAPAFGSGAVAAAAALEPQRREAIRAIEANNNASPRIASADYGMKSSNNRPRPSFNYYSGQ